MSVGLNVEAGALIRLSAPTAVPSATEATGTGAGAGAVTAGGCAGAGGSALRQPNATRTSAEAMSETAGLDCSEIFMRITPE